jgi:transposase
LDLVEGRDSAAPDVWFARHGVELCEHIKWATPDLSGSYRKVFNSMQSGAVQIADPFHVVKPANTMLDEARRRIQNETHGHRGRKQDPLYHALRKLVMGADRHTDSTDNLLELLATGDPKGEVTMAWHAN